MEFELCLACSSSRSVEDANFKAHLQNGSILYSPVAQGALQHSNCNTDTASVTLHMIILSSRINAGCSKNVEKENQSLSSQCSLYMAFKYCISLATNLVENIGCYQFSIMPEIISKLLLSTI